MRCTTHEGKRMTAISKEKKPIFQEENGFYEIDCTKAVWATNEIHALYQQAGFYIIKDVDFVIETLDKILLVEYKNASIPGASAPDAFNPHSDSTFQTLVRKFYDSFHYLRLKGKGTGKAIQYICVIEYPKGNSVTRKKLRKRLKSQLPFELPSICGSKESMIEAVDVVSIDEWNANEFYGAYPIRAIEKKG